GANNEHNARDHQSGCEITTARTQRVQKRYYANGDKCNPRDGEVFGSNTLSDGLSSVPHLRTFQMCLTCRQEPFVRLVRSGEGFLEMLNTGFPNISTLDFGFRIGGPSCCFLRG